MGLGVFVGGVPDRFHFRLGGLDIREGLSFRSFFAISISLTGKSSLTISYATGVFVQATLNVVDSGLIDSGKLLFTLSLEVWAFVDPLLDQVDGE